MYETIPNRTEKSPSYHDVRYSWEREILGERTKIKIHAHPGLPPTPSMLSIAAARSPENADAKPVAENIIEILCVT